METREVVDYILKMDYENIPTEVITKARSCILDYLGAALYGSTKEWSKYICHFAKSAGCKEESTVIGKNWKTSPQYAALVNGTMGHGFEVDDFHSRAFLHPGTVVIPAALAVGEKERADGKRFLTAIVLGYEIMIGLGLALGISHLMRGFHATGTHGTFGATTAVGKMLNLNRNEMSNAFGLAGSLASGIKEFYLEGAMVKRLHAGKGAENGVIATLLARLGFTGPATVLEGKFGYCKAFSDDPHLSKLKENLNERWEILNISVKPYACCGGLQPTINGLIELKSKYGFHPGEIEKITIETDERTALQNSGPGTKSVMAAQYSIPFSAAITLLKDIEDPAIFNESILDDGDILSLSKKVEVLGTLKDADAGIEKSNITVKLKAGKEYRIGIDKPKGHPGNPLSYDEVVRKFGKLSSHVLPEINVNRIIEHVSGLEKLGDISILSDLARI